jgi:methylenetetrahydrofolate reductase (NADPH)
VREAGGRSPHEAGSAPERLRAALQSSRFLVTAELECPRNASAANVERQARACAGLADAVDCTDNSAALVRMSPVAAAAIATRAGVTALIQLTCRDRNRIALQSEILGAAAAGAAGVVCITGDPPVVGNHPDAAAVYDLDSTGLLRVLRGMAEGSFASGEPLQPPVDLVRGCVENPADGAESVARLAAKAEAGAEFVQTQIGFGIDEFASWLHLLHAEGLDRRLRVLAGVAPIRRLSVARFLATRVAGVRVPDWVLARLERAVDVEAEGVRIAAELVRELRRLDGVAGVHLLTFGWSAGVARVLRAEAGLLQGDYGGREGERYNF